MKRLFFIILLIIGLIGCDNTDDGPFSWSKRNGANILVTIKNEPVNGTVEFSEIDYIRNITLTTAKVKLKEGLPYGEWQVFNTEGSLILEGDGKWEISNGVSIFDGTIKVTNCGDIKDIKLKGRFNIDIIHFENMGINLSRKPSITSLLGNNGVRAISLKNGTTITKKNGNTVTFKNNHIVKFKDVEKDTYIELSEKADRNNLYDISFISKHYENGKEYTIKVKTKGELSGKLNESKISLSKDTIFATYDNKKLIEKSQIYYVQGNYENEIYNYKLINKESTISLNSDYFNLNNFNIKDQYTNLTREHEKLVIDSKEDKKRREEARRIHEEKMKIEEAESRERLRLMHERELEIKRQEKEEREKFHNTKMEYDMNLMNY